MPVTCKSLISKTIKKQKALWSEYACTRPDYNDLHCGLSIHSVKDTKGGYIMQTSVWKLESFDPYASKFLPRFVILRLTL